MGCDSDKEIIYLIIDNNNSKLDNILSKMIKKSLENVAHISTKREAVTYLSNELSYTSNQVLDLINK